MSLNARIGLVKKIIQEFKRFPEESNKIYPSFRDAQIKRYEEGLSTSQSKLPSLESLDKQTEAVKIIGEGINKSKFPVSNRLLEPNGMPTYYQRILNEANRGKTKISLFTALKDTYFGWWK